LSADDSVPHRLGMWLSGFGEQPDQIHARTTVAELARRLVAQLPNPTDQKIVALYFWEGLVDREISERLDMPTNTVTWRRHRAIAELRRIHRRGRARARFTLVAGDRKELVP